MRTFFKFTTVSLVIMATAQHVSAEDMWAAAEVECKCDPACTFTTEGNPFKGEDTITCEGNCGDCAYTTTGVGCCAAGVVQRPPCCADDDAVCADGNGNCATAWSFACTTETRASTDCVEASTGDGEKGKNGKGKGKGKGAPKGTKAPKGPKAPKGSKAPKAPKAPKGKRLQALKKAQATHARSEIGAGVALVGMIGFIALVAAKTLGRDGTATEATSLLEAVRSDDAIDAMQA